MVFALDTTGSMGGLLEGAKEKIWSIASELARGQPTPVLKVGLVEALPDELRAMKKSERKARVEQLQQERAALEKHAGRLARQREEWLSKNAPDKADAFDTSVKESLKGRAAEFGIRY